MKKIISLLLAAALLTITACSAGSTNTNSSESGSSDGVITDATPDGSEAGAENTTEGTTGGEIAVSSDGMDMSYVCDDNNRVFYEIFVGSFSDSNGDGIGDLRGIIKRMDYLNDGDPASGKSLGVEGLWLTPVFSSPSYHKYDVADYYSIDPDFGTMEDLQELIALCHERNVKLILDMPINHTAKRNSWYSAFVLARRQGDTESPYYDFYSTYTEGETAPAGRKFEKVSGTDIYCECNFSGDMPELNYDCAGVREAVLDVAKYYLDIGVDGFRFDAAKYIYLGDNPASAEFWSWYMSELRAVKSDIYAVAEVWDADGITDIYYPALNCFDFSIAQSGGLLADTANHRDATRLTSYVDKYLKNVTAMREDATIVPFISNHDMDRAAGFLTVSSGNMKVAANLYLLSPGSPFIYYGEEIGMKGSRGGANTDANRRLAMLWGDGDTVKDPTGTTYDSSKQADTDVARQLSDPDSLLSYYKKLLMIRNANPEIASGTYTSLALDGTKLGGFISEWQGRSVCVIHNTTAEELTLDLSGVSEISAMNASGISLAAYIGPGGALLSGSVLTIGAQTSVVMR